LPNTRPNKNKITEENTIVKVEILSYFWHAEQGLSRIGQGRIFGGWGRGKGEGAEKNSSIALVFVK